MQQQPTLALKNIQVSINPRKYFDAAEMEELTASVREKGVIQPVIVRTLADGGFSVSDSAGPVPVSRAREA